MECHCAVDSTGIPPGWPPEYRIYLDFPMDIPWPIEVVIRFVGARNKDEIYQMVHRKKLPPPMADGRKRSWWWPPTLYYWRKSVIRESLEDLQWRYRAWGLDDRRLHSAITCTGQCYKGILWIPPSAN